MGNTGQMELDIKTSPNDREIRCGVCGRILTNAKSRLIGVGPVCYGGHRSPGANMQHASKPGDQQQVVTEKFLKRLKLFAGVAGATVDGRHHDEVDSIVKKAESLKYMDIMAIADDVSRIIEICMESSVRRDDVVDGLRELINSG